MSNDYVLGRLVSSPMMVQCDMCFCLLPQDLVKVVFNGDIVCLNGCGLHENELVVA